MKFVISEMYNEFLVRSSLKEEDMHPEQKIQLKQTFYAAIGQMPLMSKEHTEATIESLINQTIAFYKKQ